MVLERFPLLPSPAFLSRCVDAWSRHKTPTEHHTTLTACKCDREKTRKREASPQLSNLFSPCLAWRGGGSRQPGGPLLEAEAEAASQRSPHPSRTPETDGREETQTSSASLPSPPSSLSAPNLKESLSAGRPISINLSPSQLSSVTPDMRGSDLSSPSASLPLLDVGGGLPCHVEHNATMQSARGEGRRTTRQNASTAFSETLLAEDALP